MLGKNPTRKYLTSLLTLIVSASMLAGCSLSIPNISPANPTDQPEVPESTPIPVPLAETTFIVRIPTDTPLTQGLSLDVLDEVTGLALNAKQNLMTPIQAGVYTVKIISPIGSILKYRYSRIGSPPVIEFSASGKQIRYRLYHVQGPAQVEDLVSAWTDHKYSGPTGRIQGTLVDASSQLPIPGLLVVAGGVPTISSSDGSFLLEGLQPGQHNLFAYSMDGKYQPFQQGAVVGENATTPTPISLVPAQVVKVTFNVSIPQSPLNPLPVRMVGNLYSLGNTFADLNGGLSTIANRAPILTPRADGKYTITLNLPVGFHLQYKYSLGDGFWNAEHTSAGQFRLRELIIPSQDLVIDDSVSTWKAPGSESVTFTLSVPVNTPASDIVSIQFNPFGWTEPIPMWPLGNNQWIYTLYSPLHILGNIGYRYCRNDACGIADDQATAGADAPGWPFASSLIHQDFQDQVDQWFGWQPSGQPTTIVANGAMSKGSGFIAGIEMQTTYRPSWLAHFDNGLQNIRDLGSNWVFLSPSAHFTSANPPVLESSPGMDMLWTDLTPVIYQGQTKGLLVGLHPQTFMDDTYGNWWTSSNKDPQWWTDWFARYRTFSIHNADLAAASNVSALILGDPNLLPAYPGGTLPDGSSSQVPENAEQQWRDLINEVRQHYRGLLIWSIPTSSDPTVLPAFLDQVDAIALDFMPDVADHNQPAQVDLLTQFGQVLDSEIQPIQARFSKPIILNVSFPSVDGAAQACILFDSYCLKYESLEQPNQVLPRLPLDLQEQVDLYNAFLQSVNDRAWINGVISDGYFPAAPIMNQSSSIHGKPAADVIWYWYHEFLK